MKLDTLNQRRKFVLLIFFGTIFLMLGCLIGFDVWIEENWGKDATISRAMHDAPPIIVAGFSFLCGSVIAFLIAHFWWSAKETGSP